MGLVLLGGLLRVIRVRVRVRARVRVRVRLRLRLRVRLRVGVGEGDPDPNPKPSPGLLRVQAAQPVDAQSHLRERLCERAVDLALTVRELRKREAEAGHGGGD